MLTLKLSNINNNGFMNALNKLGESSKLDVKTAYNLSRLLKEVDRESRDAREEFQKVLKNFVKLDDKGAIVPDVEVKKDAEGNEIVTPIPGTWVFNHPEDEEGKAKFMEDWKKANQDFMEVEVKFEKVRPLKVDELEKAELSAQDLNALEPVLVDEPHLSVVQ